MLNNYLVPKFDSFEKVHNSLLVEVNARILSNVSNLQR